MTEFLRIQNLDKDYADLKSLADAGKKINVLSMAESARPHAAAALCRFVLYIARDRIHAIETGERLKSFVGKKTAVLNPKDDFLIYKQGAGIALMNERSGVLRDILSGDLGALVVSPEVLMQYLPNPTLFKKYSATLKTGAETDIYGLSDALTKAGYSRVERISAAGEFALRGDVMDVYPVSDNPVRVNFFGDIIESVRVIDPDSMIGIREIKEITVYPASGILLEESGLNNIRERIERQEIPKGADRTRIKNITEGALTRLSNPAGNMGFDWIIPFAKESFSTIFDWLPGDAAIVIDEPGIIGERLKGYYRAFYERVTNLTRSGEIYPVHKDAAVDENRCYSGIAKYPAVAYLNISSLNPIFMPDAILNMPSIKTAPYYTDYNMLISDLKAFLKTDKRVVLCCKDNDRAKTIYDGLNDKFRDIKSGSEPPVGFGGIYVTPLKIRDGFALEKSRLVVIGYDDLFRKQKKILHSSRKKTDYIPSPSDFVVHDIHGIGKFLGIEKVKTGGLVRDYGRVEYKDGQMLFVPVENLDKLSKYSGGGEPKLSKMGGAEFSKVKESVKKSVRQLAFSLLELYNKRETAAGFVYSKDTEWQREFEDSFEFDETEDQLKAVDAIKSDLENGRIMDRLLCGDVGYGKTEVALRAVFKVVMDGKQAAILAPTTILARQHYNTVMARTKDFKLNVGILSRFESKETTQKTLNDLKNGKLNIIVATHRLLSKDVCFFDLGLLVLDEEQRFGVEHKEKIKTIKNNVNVLTLSATPIPRTLHMSLSGIRDISLLETPPQNRIPVETYVTEFSEGLIKDAVQREKSRGGQTFILYNRVENIDGFAYGISKLFDESDGIRIIVAHGQMAGTVLDEQMTAFYNGEADILICTTIIENGLDLPNANTIIICDADKLGLATLYQLRGRVGRGGQVAHAYFTYSSGKIMNENAMKRLNAVMDYTDFGSGYKLAMRDLEIRGAGNVLGSEQHGHMQKVGYEMYSRLLREAVGALKGEITENTTEAEVRFDVDIDTYVDDKYVAGAEKIELYSKIAAIDSRQKKENYIAELTDVYGKPDKALVNLIDIAIIKNMAAKIGAIRVMINSRGLGVVFDRSFVGHNKLIKAITRDKGVVLTGGEKTPTLVFNAKNMTMGQKIDRLTEFLEKAI
ncbi:MAG: transcription-repair coupling factor [Clostridiales bacterium]|jgi:transcription-repair coupling factor (superfamily II helicase)|nr:transcription-repair coupling factor [Clostridiales bacterium]